MTTRNRAPKGGTVGVNGEFYEGGKFLPSTQRAKSKPPKKTGKREIEPYKWEKQPTPEHESIWTKISGFCQYDEAGNLVPNQALCVDQENYFYPGYASIAVKKLDALIALFNSGNRWIECN